MAASFVMVCLCITTSVPKCSSAVWSKLLLCPVLILDQLSLDSAGCSDEN